MKTEKPSTEADSRLAARVVRVFRDNVTARDQSGADNVLMDALNAWARKPSPDELRLFQSMGVLPKTFDSLTRVKLVQIMAVLNRVFGQVGDKSWGCTASPDPVLPVDVQAEIVSKYAQEGLKLGMMSGAKTSEELAQYAMSALKANEKQIEADRKFFATERAERMETVMDDILAEAKFSERHVRNFIHNLVKFGTAVIIGPCEVPEVQLVLKGEGNSVAYKPEIKSVLRFRVPNTNDVFPSPGAVEADDADLCIRERYSKEELARAAASKAGGAWRPAAIREVLKQYPGVDISTMTVTDPAERGAQLGEVPGTTKKYEAVRWFGLSSGKELQELGINTDGIGKINPESYYEAEAVVLANRVIYAKACDPAVGRPVVKTTFYGDTAQFFGWPPALQIDNCQTLMNIAMAALKKQLQLSGLVPLVVNDYSSFVDADRPGAFALAPGKVFLRNQNAFSQSGQQGAAIQPLQLSNIIREIIALFEVIAKLADDASGFNRNILGTGNFGGAARTADGLRQIQEAGNIIATFVIGNVDAKGILPLLYKVVAWINSKHPDKRCKGDPQIIAKGQLSNLLKSAQQQVIMAGFQATQTPIMSQLLGPEKILEAFRTYMKGIEFPNVDKLIPDAERVAFLTAMQDAEKAYQTIAAANGGQMPQPGQQGQQQGQQGQQQGGGQPPRPQAQPQQAQAQAGLGMASGVKARRGAA